METTFDPAPSVGSARGNNRTARAMFVSCGAGGQGAYRDVEPLGGSHQGLVVGPVLPICGIELALYQRCRRQSGHHLPSQVGRTCAT